MLKSTYLTKSGVMQPVRSSVDLEPLNFQQIVMSPSSQPDNDYPGVSVLSASTTAPNTGWYATGAGGTSDKPAYLIYNLGSYPKICVKYSFACMGDRMAVDWKFQGDQNDSNWIDLDTHTDESITNDVVYTYKISNTIAYKRYRFYCTKSLAGSFNLGVTRLTLYGY